MFLKLILIFFLVSAAFSLSGYYFWYKPKFKPAKHISAPLKRSSEEVARLRNRTLSVKKYISDNQYNSRICFFIDMNIHSGKDRFFVYDLEKDSILASGLVAHGSCDNGFQEDARFSNKINSGCSCDGKFRIGKSYTGRFGLAYKLHGLDSSNNNAYERTIVLHSYKCVPEQEVYPMPVCNSRGCPMVSVAFLEKLKLFIDRSKDPILLSVY